MEQRKAKWRVSVSLRRRKGTVPTAAVKTYSFDFILGTIFPVLKFFLIPGSGIDDASDEAEDQTNQPANEK